MEPLSQVGRTRKRAVCRSRQSNWFHSQSVGGLAVDLAIALMAILPCRAFVLSPQLGKARGDADTKCQRIMEQLIDAQTKEQLTVSEGLSQSASHEGKGYLTSVYRPGVPSLQLQQLGSNTPGCAVSTSNGGRHACLTKRGWLIPTRQSILLIEWLQLLLQREPQLGAYFCKSGIIILRDMVPSRCPNRA